MSSVFCVFCVFYVLVVVVLAACFLIFTTKKETKNKKSFTMLPYCIGFEVNVIG